MTMRLMGSGVVSSRAERCSSPGAKPTGPAPGRTSGEHRLILVQDFDDHALDGFRGGEQQGRAV